ncbi:MAG: hypothetical protein HW378_172 [Anaerolineales bacterium]|nr:hypothetical protein [Anaerolineales bacterium]
MAWTANRYAGLGAGIEKLGDSIAGIIEAKKTEKKLAKEAEKMYALLWEVPEARAVMKVPPDEFGHTTPRREMPGTVAGVMAALKIKGMMQEQQARQQELLASAQERQARAGALTREGEAAAQLPAFFETFTGRLGQPATGPIRADLLEPGGNWNQRGALAGAFRAAPRAIESSQFEERTKALVALTGMGQDTKESLALGSALEVPGIGWLVGKGRNNPVEFQATPREPRPTKAEPAEVQLPYLPWIDGPSDKVFSREMQKFSKLLFDSGSDQGAINKVLDSIRARREDYKKGRRSLTMPELISGEETPESETPASAATPAMVSSQTEYDALASGTVYVGRDGRRYRKP